MKQWDPDLLAIWTQLTAPALERAGAALSQLTERPVTLTGIRTRVVAWPDLESLLHVPDPPGDQVYAAHLGAFGLFAADIVVLFSECSMVELVSVLTAEPAHLPVDALGLSALAEVGNIIGTAFLNVFADSFHERWEPTPPRVTAGPFASLLKDVFPDRKPQDAVLVSEALVTLGETLLEGYLAVSPRVAASSRDEA